MKYLCAIKVVDSSLYKESDYKRGKNLSCATIVVVGERMEDMPIIRKIGDIIRIQKATQKISKDGEIKYLVDEWSSWCLFSPNNTGPDEKLKLSQVQFEDLDFPEEENKENENIGVQALNIKKVYMPYRYSGKNFSFAENEEK